MIEIMLTYLYSRSQADWVTILTNVFTVLAGFNEFGFNESSRFNESVLTSKVFLLHKKFGFNKYPDLTNNWPGPERFVKSGDHCNT